MSCSNGFSNSWKLSQSGRWQCWRLERLALRSTRPQLRLKEPRAYARRWPSILGCAWTAVLMWFSWDGTLLSSLSHSLWSLTSLWTQISIPRKSSPHPLPIPIKERGFKQNLMWISVLVNLINVMITPGSFGLWTGLWGAPCSTA